MTGLAVADALNHRPRNTLIRLIYRSIFFKEISNTGTAEWLDKIVAFGRALRTLFGS